MKCPQSLLFSMMFGLQDRQIFFSWVRLYFWQSIQIMFFIIIKKTQKNLVFVHLKCFSEGTFRRLSPRILFKIINEIYFSIFLGRFVIWFWFWVNIFFWLTEFLVNHTFKPLNVHINHCYFERQWKSTYWTVYKFCTFCRTRLEVQKSVLFATKIYENFVYITEYWHFLSLA